jgi:hypothetical protein
LLLDLRRLRKLSHNHACSGSGSAPL